MQAQLILIKIAGSNNFYGLGARKYIKDPILGNEFILECYSQICVNEAGMIDCIGEESVKEIKYFYGKTIQS